MLFFRDFVESGRVVLPFFLLVVFVYKLMHIFFYSLEKALMSSDDQCLSSTTLNDHIHEQTMTSPPDLYHNSVCGSILHSIPTNNPSTIFSYLRHGNFDAFRRSYDIYHREINTMKNEHEQVNE